MTRGKNGRLVLILGIDAEQIAQLQAGTPIVVDGAAYGLGLSIDVMILYGAALEDVVADLESAGITLPEDVVAELRRRHGPREDA